MSKHKHSSASPKKSLSSEEIKKNLSFFLPLPHLPTIRPIVLSGLFAWCLTICFALFVSIFFSPDTSSPQQEYYEVNAWENILLYCLIIVFILLPFLFFCILCAKSLYRAGTLLRTTSPDLQLPGPFLLSISPFLPVYSLYWGFRSSSKWNKAGIRINDAYRSTYQVPSNKLALICSLASTSVLIFLIRFLLLPEGTAPPSFLFIFLLAGMAITLTCLYFYCLAYNYLIGDVMLLKDTHLKLAEIYEIE